MKPEQQRIAIAEACGYRRTTCPAGEVEWRGPERQFLGRFAPESIPDKVPDYLNDLNAMHAAEKNCLTNSTLEESYYFAIDRNPFASASQRAEALIRTLNIWIP